MTRKVDEADRRISRRLSAVKPSATLALAARCSAMQRDGLDVISFSTGEPDFASPDQVKRAGIDAIEQDFSHYTDSSGIRELRETIAEKFRNDNGIETDAGRVLVSSGAKAALYEILLAIVDPGDEVIVPSPYWVSYPEMVRLVGGSPVIVQTGRDEGFKMDPDQLRAALSDRTRAVILNSPSNPTGAMYSEEEIRELARVVAEAGVYLLSDEIYEKITYGTIPHYSAAADLDVADWVVTINGVSKAYAMTGWRIGYATGPADVMGAAARAQGQITSNPNSIAQKAALAGLRGAAEAVESMRKRFQARRSLCLDLFREIDGIELVEPDGAFYLFPDVSAFFNDRFGDASTLSEYLLTDHNVAVVPGEAFGNDRCIRLSFACSEKNLQEGILRIRKGLAEL